MLISDDDVRAKDSLILHLERSIKEHRATMRDDMAKAALVGIAANYSSSKPEQIARVAYAIADAMMEARAS